MKRLSSTPARTFVLRPVVLPVAEAVLQGGLPRVEPWVLPLLVWGYLQYRLVGPGIA